MKVYLKNNWSEQFIYGDKTPGYFVGRKKEIDGLKNIITENDSSSILISSVRGVGKTSFVHKTITEAQIIQKKIIPIFVNVGHALSCKDSEGSNKEKLLNALIRSAHFNPKFINDAELENIYKKDVGKYKEHESVEKETKTEKAVKVDFNNLFNINKNQLIALFFIFLTSVGITLDNKVWRIIFGILGLSGLFIGINFKKEWVDKVFRRNEIVIDDSLEWLEIKFEEWLKSKKIDNKIVFIIDELDKIDEKTSFEVIKEFKNLFTRSFTHFIFIASEKAYNLISGDRESEEEGKFPTLFTHSFYLSLPSSDELREYLTAIIESTGDFFDIKSYLLFKAKNDFFELKRLILDYTQYDNGKPFLDVDLIKKEDFNYEEIVKLYDFIDLSIDKHLKELKRYWKDNFILQKDFFSFLHGNLNKNFEDSRLNENQLLLVKILNRAEIVKESERDEERVSYIWTGSYLISKYDDLFDEEKALISEFEKFVKIANDLDDFKDKYNDNSFEEYEVITEGRDGKEFSDISLFSLYAKYLILYQTLKTSANIVSLKLETSKNALEEIKQNIDNILKNYFNVFKNLLNKIFAENTEIFRGEPLASGNFNISGIINQFPEFQPNFLNVENFVYGRTDQTKYVFIIKDFKEFDKIQSGLEPLSNNKNVLFINLLISEKVGIENLSFVKKIQKSKKVVLDKKIEVDNFVNCSFIDFRDLSAVAVKIRDFLK